MLPCIIWLVSYIVSQLFINFRFFFLFSSFLFLICGSFNLIRLVFYSWMVYRSHDKLHKIRIVYEVGTDDYKELDEVVGVEIIPLCVYNVNSSIDYSTVPSCSLRPCFLGYSKLSFPKFLKKLFSTEVNPEFLRKKKKQRVFKLFLRFVKSVQILQNFIV